MEVQADLRYIGISFYFAQKCTYLACYDTLFDLEFNVTPATVGSPALSLAVMSRSRKPDERRLPIHPLHIERIDQDLRERTYLERGYGERFGVPDEPLLIAFEATVVVVPFLALLAAVPVAWGWGLSGRTC